VGPRALAAKAEYYMRFAFLFDIANPHRQIAGGTGETVDGGRAFASFAAAVDIACFCHTALISRRRVSGSQTRVCVRSVVN